MTTLPSKAKIVIIGGGIHGLSTAWKLSETYKNPGDIVVLEKKDTAAGASGIACGEGTKLSVEELKTKLFKTSRPKSALIITEACEKGFFRLEKTSTDQRIKNIMPSESFIKEFNDYLLTLKNISY